MKYLVAGKCPPIQGGVSRETWAACENLAIAGNQVSLVTNASSVEPNFRQNLTPNDLHRVFGEKGQGSVKVIDIGSINSSGIIPDSSMGLTRMIGALLEECEILKPDLLFGYYLEPYGVAIGVVWRMTGIPYVLMHAGSDIGRLRHLPNIGPTFKLTVEGCTAMLTTQPTSRLANDLSCLGVASSQLHLLGPSCLEKEFYLENSPADLLSVDDSESRFPLCNYRADMTELLSELDGNQLTGTVYGVLGKIHPAKCNLEIVGALELLLSRGKELSVLACVGGYNEHLKLWLEKINGTKYLRKRIRIIPLVAPWRVPDVLNVCDGIFFLEHGFDLEYHSSRLPLEILARRKVMLLSTSSASTLPFFSFLQSKENCLLVDEPRDVEALAEACSFVCDEKKRESIVRNSEQVREIVLKRIGVVNRVSAALLSISHGKIL